MVAAIHAQGPHPDEPLLDLNCGAIPEALMESQLFGHERGAFTGADRRQDGYFALVRKGTLFLDEIAELSLPLQAKLLRVLETGRFRPVGASAVARFGGRIVAATHANLSELVSRGQFREDLLYRLDVLTVPVPALAERTEDIPALVAHFVRQQQRALRFTAEAMDLLCCMPWPGNVRQLRNLIDRLAVFAEDEEITPDVVRPFLRLQHRDRKAGHQPGADCACDPAAAGREQAGGDPGSAHRRGDGALRRQQECGGPSARRAPQGGGAPGREGARRRIGAGGKYPRPDVQRDSRTLERDSRTLRRLAPKRLARGPALRVLTGIASPAVFFPILAGRFRPPAIRQPDAFVRRWDMPMARIGRFISRRRAAR